ncbi:MAG: Maf family protein [Actinomycetes bacterium]
MTLHARTPALRFVLASASPARLALLRSAGVDPEVIVSGVDEDAVNGTPREVALLLAQHKAAAVVDRLASTDAVGAGNAPPVTLVLACDSVLELDGEAHGKPPDVATAVERWKSMRGRRGVLHTGHSLVKMDGQRQSRHELASAEVRFGNPTDAEIMAYVATGEPLLVAGGFTLDRLGGWFVESIDGDPGTVLGLSLPLLRSMLAHVGVGVPTLWGLK